MGCSIIENVNTLASGNFRLETCSAAVLPDSKVADVVPPPPTLSPIHTAAEPAGLELEMDLDLNYPSPADDLSGVLPPALVDELIATTVAELLLGNC